MEENPPGSEEEHEEDGQGRGRLEDHNVAVMPREDQGMIPYKKQRRQVLSEATKATRMSNPENLARWLRLRTLQTLRFNLHFYRQFSSHTNLSSLLHAFWHSLLQSYSVQYTEAITVEYRETHAAIPLGFLLRSAVKTYKTRHSAFVQRDKVLSGQTLMILLSLE